MASSYSILAVCVLCVYMAAPSAGQLADSNAECNSATEGYWRPLLAGDCNKEYSVCRSFSWRNAVCVVGHFNVTLGRCEKFTTTCINADSDLYFPNGQEAATAGCADYNCPTSIRHVLVYPNWANTNCNTFNVCWRGTLKTQNCPTGYTYYNPRLLSCEQYPALTNTCVWRQFADYAPFA